MTMMTDIDDLVDTDMPDLPEFDMLADVDGNAMVHEESSSKVLEEWRQTACSPLMQDVVDEIMQIDVQLGDEDLLDDKLFFNDPSICLSPTSALDDLDFSPTILDEKDLILFSYPDERELQDSPTPNIHPGIPTPPPSVPFSSSGSFSFKPAADSRPTAVPNSSITPKTKATKPKSKPRKPATPKPYPHDAHAHPHAHYYAHAGAHYAHPPPHHHHPGAHYVRHPPPHAHYMHPPSPPTYRASASAPKKSASSSPKKAPTSRAPDYSTAGAKHPMTKAATVTPVSSSTKNASPVSRTLPAKSASAGATRTPTIKIPSAKKYSSAPSSPTSSEATAKVGSYEEHYRQMRKLSESMVRSQESRKCFHMKTDKTEQYEREASVSDVLTSIDQSTRQLQHYLCGGHTYHHSHKHGGSEACSTSTKKTAASQEQQPRKK